MFVYNKKKHCTLSDLRQESNKNGTSDVRRETHGTGLTDVFLSLCATRARVRVYVLARETQRSADGSKLIRKTNFQSATCSRQRYTTRISHTHSDAHSHTCGVGRGWLVPFGSVCDRKTGMRSVVSRDVVTTCACRSSSFAFVHAHEALARRDDALWMRAHRRRRRRGRHVDGHIWLRLALAPVFSGT